MEWGTDAVVGYPIAKETAAMLATPYTHKNRTLQPAWSGLTRPGPLTVANFFSRSSSETSRISGENRDPLSYTKKQKASQMSLAEVGFQV